VAHTSKPNNAAATCEGCASSFRASISFICMDDCNDGANIELTGDDDSTTATGFNDGSSLQWESLPHLLGPFA
jgi:hypothetical protein